MSTNSPRRVPRLRVLAGPSLDKMEVVQPNTGMPHDIRSEAFEGRVVIHVKGLVGEDGVMQEEHEYFSRKERRGVTWSIQVQGRFLQTQSADTVLFGNTFDRPLKLPWGTSAALKFMNFIDPTLENDLMGPTPWALSPLIATMPYFAHQVCPANEPLPEFPVHTTIQDDTSQLRPQDSSEPPLNLGPPNKRRAYFSSVPHRETVVYHPSDVITTDFCYGFLSFPQLALTLPGGLSFDLMKYWDGQPVRFVCCERAEDGDGSDSGTSEELRIKSRKARSTRRVGGPGRVFWCVMFEVVPDGEE